jgi:hypothetical protein
VRPHLSVIPPPVLDIRRAPLTFAKSWPCGWKQIQLHPGIRWLCSVAWDAASQGTPESSRPCTDFLAATEEDFARLGSGAKPILGGSEEEPPVGW